MISVLYEIGLHLLALIALPKFLFQLCKKGKYRSNFLKRWGRGFPLPSKTIQRPLIWVHAVSLGETKAVSTLIKELKKKHFNCSVLLTTVTETGFAEGKRSIPEADIHAFLPFDFSYIIRPIVRKVNPQLVILVETDFWLNFQKAAKECGAHIVVVNAKLSERSQRRFTKLPRYSHELFKTIDHFFLQNPLYLERFKSIGISEDKLTVTGNLKLDHQESIFLESQKSELRKKLGIDSNTFVLTLGSTHSPEERLFINALKKIHFNTPFKVLIVPRHPERFNEVAELLEREEVPFSRYSLPKNAEASFILIDTMGVLNKCYQLSNLAFVGGTFNEKVGGHNILEPAFYAVPVITGPYLFSQPNFSEIMLQYSCGTIVEKEQLISELTRLINSPQERLKMGDNGKKAVQELGGAVQRILEKISFFLS